MPPRLSNGWGSSQCANLLMRKCANGIQAELKHMPGCELLAAYKNGD